MYENYTIKTSNNESDIDMDIDEFEFEELQPGDINLKA